MAEHWELGGDWTEHWQKHPDQVSHEWDGMPIRVKLTRTLKAECGCELAEGTEGILYKPSEMVEGGVRRVIALLFKADDRKYVIKPNYERQFDKLPEEVQR